MRGFLSAIVLALVGSAGIYIAYETVVKPKQAMQEEIRHQQETITKLEQDKVRLEAFLRILKRIERRARVEVLKQDKDAHGNLQSTIRFTEIDDSGKPIAVFRDLTLPGQEIYFDTMVIKFDDHFVEQSDPLKGQALMLFRRIFSSTMRAEDGIPIDPVGQPPAIYAGKTAPSDFERDIWKRFWEIANNEQLAKEKGVRAIHGDAPYMRMEPDRVYEVALRSTGEVIITPGVRVVP